MALWLRERGHRASALAGGFDAWRDGGFPLVPLGHDPQSVASSNGTPGR